MTTQRTPEELSTQQENALICERLLGLKKHCDDRDCPDWRTADGKRFWGTPSFTNWREAGLILDALAKAGQRPDTSYYDGWCCFVDANCGDDPDIKIFDTGPSAVRAAALAYIRSLP